MELMAIAATSAAGRMQSVAAWLRARLPRDARVAQIVFLAMLLGTGVFARDFSLRWEQMALTFIAGLATQALALRVLRVPNASFLSAVVTCFGLSILLRADSLWVHPLVAALAMASKFALRIRGRHVFNPANVGVVAALCLLPGTWVSAGQWGHDLAAAVWFVMLGTVVTGQARRWEVSWMFLACYLGLVGTRVLVLGQPVTVFMHHLGNGALLLFAFFMISDPMTTPSHRGARLFHAALVAGIAFLWQFVLYRTNGLLWALFLCVPTVVLLDCLFPAERFRWRTRRDPEAGHEPPPRDAAQRTGYVSGTPRQLLRDAHGPEDPAHHGSPTAQAGTLRSFDR